MALSDDNSRRSSGKIILGLLNKALGYADDPEMPMQVRIHLCRSKKRRLIWMLVLGVANGAATDLAASKQAHSRQHSQPASRHAELVVVASCPRRGRSGWR